MTLHFYFGNISESISRSARNAAWGIFIMSGVIQAPVSCLHEVKYFIRFYPAKIMFSHYSGERYARIVLDGANVLIFY